VGEESAWLQEETQQHEPLAVISKAALEGTAALCVQVLDLCVACYGAKAGNRALKIMVRHEVFVGGGIAPKIIEKLTSFMRTFTARCHLRPLLEATPVRVMMNDKTALLGAPRCAVLRGAAWV
jgi:glucokinase